MHIMLECGGALGVARAQRSGTRRIQRDAVQHLRHGVMKLARESLPLLEYGLALGLLVQPSVFECAAHLLGERHRELPMPLCTTSAGNRRGGAWFYAAAVVSWRRLERRAVRMAVVAMRPALVRW